MCFDTEMRTLRLQECEYGAPDALCLERTEEIQLSSARRSGYNGMSGPRSGASWWYKFSPLILEEINGPEASCRTRNAHLLWRISEDITIEVLWWVGEHHQLEWTSKIAELTAFPSSLKNSPPMHQRWFPLGSGVRVAFARRLGGPSTSSSVTLWASSHSLRIY